MNTQGIWGDRLILFFVLLQAKILHADATDLKKKAEKKGRGIEKDLKKTGKKIEKGAKEFEREARKTAKKYPAAATGLVGLGELLPVYLPMYRDVNCFSVVTS